MKQKINKVSKKAGELQEKSEEFINKLHNGETKGYIDYVKELETLKSFPLQQIICKSLLKRKQSYTKFHFRKQDLKHYVYTTEKIATFLEGKGNKSLANTVRQEKNDWLSTGLWNWRKKNIDKKGKMITKKHKTTGKKQKATGKQQKAKHVPILTQQGKPLMRGGKPVHATLTATGEIIIVGGL